MFASFLEESEPNDHEFRDFTPIGRLSFNGPETPNVVTTNKDNLENLDNTMKIYLRFRPVSDNQVERPYEILNANSIAASAPEQSTTYRNVYHGCGKSYQKFTFSNVFAGSASQECIFNEVSQNIINDFIHGSDRLLFTYGTTSSGKTYTMNGNRKAIGLIPRALNYLFKSVKLANNPSLMPVDFSEVSSIKKVDIGKILKEKSILVKLSEKESSDVLGVLESENKENLLDNTVSSNDTNGLYETTFWISYMEIYNEFIYDLLDPTTASSMTNANNNGNKNKRQMLEIRTAKNGGSYVRGLKLYPIYSAEEAYRLLLVGRKNQSMGATKLNQNSSRSHTILTIRAVRCMSGSEYISKVSNLCFCDLAGSERTEKAFTTGISQKEAANINSSLLALGRCIDTLKYNQNNPTSQRVIPYRDSKLTRLFQTFLGGNGKASMIVCMNQSPNLFDESLQVLKFSALARKVVMNEKEKKEKKIVTNQRRSSMYRRLAMRTPNKPYECQVMESAISDEEGSQSTVENGSSEEEYEEQYDVQELLDIIERLKAELIATRKEKIVTEVKLRDTINEEWSQTVMHMERENARYVKKIRNQMQEEMKKVRRREREKAFRELKKRRIQPDEEYCSTSSEEDLEEQISELSDELESKDQEIKFLKAQLMEVQTELEETTQRADNFQSKWESTQVDCRGLEYRCSVGTSDKGNVSQSIHNSPSKNSLDFPIEETSLITDMSFDNISPLVSNKIKVDGSASKLVRNAAFNRFSKFSVNPETQDLPVVVGDNSFNRNCESRQCFFDPISSPVRVVEYQSPTKETSTPKTEASFKNLFKIVLDSPEEQDISFLNNERSCQIEELESQRNELERENVEKIIIIKDQSQQIAELQATIEAITEKLVSREKCMSKMSDKDNNTHRRLDNLLDLLNIAVKRDICGAELRIKDKLKLVSGKLQTMKTWLDNVLSAVPENQRQVLKDCTNAELSSVEIDTNCIANYIKQLENDLIKVQNDYQQLISVCNDLVIDQAKAHLNLKIKRISKDTSLQDISSRLRGMWSCAVEIISDLSSQRLTPFSSTENQTLETIESEDSPNGSCQDKENKNLKKSKNSKGKGSKKNKSQ